MQADQRIISRSLKKFPPGGWCYPIFVQGSPNHGRHKAENSLSYAFVFPSVLTLKIPQDYQRKILLKAWIKFTAINLATGLVNSGADES